MRGQSPFNSMKNQKSTLYPIVALALLLGLVAIVLSLFQFQVWVEPQSPDTASLPMIAPPSTPAVEKVVKPMPAVPAVSPASPTPDVLPAKSPNPAEIAARQGTLRVSNPTQHPIRLALLSQQSSTKTYGEPAHWDFAPGEGGGKGLILSLSQGNLKLAKGDILVAFAQDGSRQYWGPFVVGETAKPVWNQQQAEWMLILQP